MDLNTITAADFKAHFRRDFPYLPNYDSGKLYNEGNKVYYPVTELFYVCLVNGTTGVLPTDVNKWAVSTGTIDDYIEDDDITKAFAEAQINYNQSLFGTDDQIKLGYLYLSAHYLAVDIRNSANGIAANGAFPVSSRTVGSVSESYSIPAAYTDTAIYAMYSQTGYGMKYLSMVLPQLVGNVGIAYGGTLP
jgi:hypothetical protein